MFTTCRAMSERTRSFILAALVLSLVSLPASAALSSADPCAAAVSLPLGGALHLEPSHVRGGLGNESLWVQAVAPAAGILRVEVSAPLGATWDLELQSVALGCRGVKGAEPVVLERSALHLVMLVAPRAEPYFFRVGARDPRRDLGAVKVQSAFVAGQDSEGIIARGGEDEEEIEIEADPVTLLAPTAVRTVPAMLQELCQRGHGADDHGDSFSCATWLGGGEDIVGEIGREGDVDMFLVVLGVGDDTREWAVEIDTEGNVDTHGMLFDRLGRRLGHDDDGGSGRNFRLVKTLGPGLYYVRVEGYGGAEGRYRIRFGTDPQ